ncbi:P-loop containing nucleoside triphosphate hydrolase protein [Haematococcus lacustris]
MVEEEHRYVPVDRGRRVHGSDGRDGKRRRSKSRSRSRERPIAERDHRTSKPDRDLSKGQETKPHPSSPKHEVKQEPEAEEEKPLLAKPNGSAPGRQEPLSLEELLKRKRQQQEEEAKPKFLSKKEREALALQRLAAQRAGPAPAAADRPAASSPHGALPPPPPLTGGRSDRDRDRDRDRERDRGDGRDREGRDRDGRDRDGRDGRDRGMDRGYDRDRDRRDRDSGRGGREGDRGGAKAGAANEPKSKWQEERERERELEMIKQQYLGMNKLKKRVIRPSEKYKFNFEWGAEEDTSKDLNPLYANPHEATLLFGRGMRAGIDRREQKKKAAEFEADMLRKSRSAYGLATDTLESRAADAARADMADRYEGADMRVEKHWTEKSLAEMTERDWRIFREDFNIQYKGSNNSLPMRNWEEGNFPREIMKAIEKAGYKKPSPIQMAAIPLGLAQRDVIGVAETGSGKTAAFVIPMLTYIMRQPPLTEVTYADGPYAVVLAPTRELAQQIEEETAKLAEFTPYKTVSIVGGQSIEEQGTKLRKGCEIVIATPYRLIDCLERSYAVLNQCNYIVLDEADRMIDLGFEPQVLGVMEAMPSTNLRPENEEDEKHDRKAIYRTTYMFSATMPMAVERLARKYLRRPIVVNIGNAGRATDNVSQRVVVCKENEKANRLEQELDLVDEKRAIVFVNTKRQCDNVYGKLDTLGYRCAVLHGGKSQEQRETSIKGFRDDTYNILIATDVAGRGIDVPDVALVINYDMPNTIEAYTHRIGRTGRAGKKGTALTFLTLSDTDVFFDLKKLLEDSKAPVPPELARHEAAKMKPGSLEAKNKRPDVQYAKK